MIISFGNITAGTLIGVGVGTKLFGSILGKSSADKANETNLKIARETNQANRELAEQQNQWNLEQWNRENEYNTPAAQRQRMLDAGINPLGTNFESGNASQLTSANLANQQIGGLQDAAGMGNLVSGSINQFGQSLLDAGLIESQIRKNNADAGLTQAQQQTEDQLRYYRVEEQKWLNRKTAEEIKEIQANVDKIKSDKAYIDACKGLKESEKEAIDLTLPYIADMQQAELNKTIQELENLKIQYKLSEEKIKYVNAQIKVCRSQEAANYASARASNAQADYTAGALTNKTNQEAMTSFAQYGTTLSQGDAADATARREGAVAELTEKFGEAAAVVGIVASVGNLAGAATKIGGNLLQKGIGKLSKKLGPKFSVSTDGVNYSSIKNF